MDNQDRILGRIRKMLNLANDAAATDGERENAMRMAHATMVKYNLDLEDVEAAGAASTEQRGIHQARFFGRPWARRVCQSMAKLFFCKYVYNPNSNAKEILHHFVGLTANATAAAEMAEYLVNSIRRESRSQARAAGKSSSWARSFADGTSVAIWQRVAKMVKQPEVEISESRALVLANRYQVEETKNQEYMDKNFGKTKQGRAGKAAGDGFLEGTIYGNTVSHNRQANHDQPKAALK